MESVARKVDLTQITSHRLVQKCALIEEAAAAASLEAASASLEQPAAARKRHQSERRQPAAAAAVAARLRGPPLDRAGSPSESPSPTGAHLRRSSLSGSSSNNSNYSTLKLSMRRRSNLYDLASPKPNVLLPNFSISPYLESRNLCRKEFE